MRRTHVTRLSVSRRFNDLVLLVPDEVWQLIFIAFAKPNSQTKDIELAFRIFSKVSTRWSLLVGELICIFFKFDVTHSNWILSHFPDLSHLEFDNPLLAKSIY